MIDDEKIQEAADLARGVRNYLRYMAAMGVRRLPPVEKPALGLPVAAREPEAARTVPVEPGRAGESLADIQRDLGDCTRCGLSVKRNEIVFGEGAENAALMFIGEGPGADEDRRGRPFVGKAGQLLTDLIVKGMKRRREECYIANIVKCRPPGNRDPEPGEAAACMPFLRRQIRAIRPVVIVALGRVAAQYLLDTDAPIGRLRGRFHALGEIAVMPTYHPSYLLRQPERKRETWEDIKQVMARLDEAGR